MRILLIVVVGIVALLIVRLMLSAAPRPRAAAESEPEKRSRKPRSKHKRRSRKHKESVLREIGDAVIDEVIENRDSKPWRRPKDSEWVPGQPIEACPNRKNQFHECTPYCFQRWGQRPPEIIASDK
jgi:hypothetical protein